MFLEFVCESCGYENHQDIENEEYISTEDVALIEAKCVHCDKVTEYEVRVEKHNKGEFND